MMERLFSTLLSILKKQTGLDPLPFNPGCAAAEIAEAERSLGVRLPGDYTVFLRRHNGQNDPFMLTFPPDQLVFLSLEKVVRLWEELKDAPDDQFFDTFDSENLTRNVLQHPGRIPIAHNESGGAYLMLDYVPGPNGKEGQLVFNVNEVDIVVVEDNFASLIETFVRLLEDGKMVVKKQPPEYGQGYWFVSSADERLDWTTYQRLKNEARPPGIRSGKEKKP
jgi:cell wall assembly regulator SMI1